jgi:beta-glucosidase
MPFVAAIVILLSLLAAPASRSQQTAGIETRINSLLAQMTLAEKLGQLQQLDGEAMVTFVPNISSLLRKGCLGSTLNVRGAKRTNQLQRVAVEESRLKIPNLFGYDVIHGYRTIFPIPLGEAASWDPDIGRTFGKYRSCGNLRFRCSLDLRSHARHCPRSAWGRITEGAGEDPFLGAAFARARVWGFKVGITVLRERFWRVPNTGWPMVQLKAVATTTQQRCLNRHCAEIYFLRFMRLLTQVSVP